ERHNITPQALNKALDETFERANASPVLALEKEDIAYLSKDALQAKVRKARKDMEKAAMDMDFIQAAHFRDEIERMQNQLKTLS
ncbi:MAG: UvrB/UvrC motif-containing protein, partial [Flavobacteriaceae bacterium]